MNKKTFENDPNELKRFKREINLIDYAMSEGYKPVSRYGGDPSIQRAATLKNHATGHKIAAHMAADGYYLYKSVAGPYDDNGSIIDFVKARHGYTLGETRAHLRDYSPSYERSHRAILAQPVARDRSALVRRYAAMPGVSYESGHPYLQRRGLGGDVLSHPRFRGRVRTGPMGEAVFPHFDKDGLSGYEMKNQGFTGFPEGSSKGLWLSNTTRQDEKLVITEGAIDSLSHFAIHRDEKTRYVSTGGAWNEQTPELIKATVARHPGKTVVLGYDNDEAGRKFDQKTREVLKDSGKEIITETPTKGKDWNDQLTGKDSRIEKAAAKHQEQSATIPPAPASLAQQPDNDRAKTTPEKSNTTPETTPSDAAKSYLAELRDRRPSPPARDQDKTKGRNFGR